MPITRQRSHTKEEAYFIILRRMFLEGRLKRGDFEPSRMNTGISGDITVAPEPQSSSTNERNSNLKRSSIRKWFRDLEKSHCIEKTRTARLDLEDPYYM
jgi:hypothetical protein